jgi:hypothetical protein
MNTARVPETKHDHVVCVVDLSDADVPFVDPGPDSMESLDPDPEGKKDPQNKEKKVNKFLFEVIDVLF